MSNPVLHFDQTVTYNEIFALSLSRGDGSQGQGSVMWVALNAGHNFITMSIKMLS
jgi:hypothetical protein